MATAVSDAAAATNSDGDDVENGQKRNDGYMLMTGGAVSALRYVLTLASGQWLLLASGWCASPTEFEQQPLSNAFPFLPDHHRRVITGLATRRLSWGGTCQVLEMPWG
jgi:hypothetical protein